MREVAVEGGDHPPKQESPLPIRQAKQPLDFVHAAPRYGIGHRAYEGCATEQDGRLRCNVPDCRFIRRNYDHLAFGPTKIDYDSAAWGRGDPAIARLWRRVCAVGKEDIESIAELRLAWKYASSRIKIACKPAFVSRALALG
jgi:hypothetical protein